MLPAIRALYPAAVACREETETETAAAAAVETGGDLAPPPPPPPPAAGYLCPVSRRPAGTRRGVLVQCGANRAGCWACAEAGCWVCAEMARLCLWVLLCWVVLTVSSQSTEGEPTADQTGPRSDVLRVSGLQWSRVAAIIGLNRGAELCVSFIAIQP